MIIRYKAIVAYNGKNYHGWARQTNSLTIQELIEKAIFKSFKQEVKIFGAGRTDAGVNASGQVFHFDMQYFKISNFNFITAINYFLPDDIKILKLAKVNKNFNARFSAKSKIYKYTINTGQVNPITSSFVYQYNKKLIVKKIKECCLLFIGKKNFLSFSTDARNCCSFVREVSKIWIQSNDSLVTIYIKGNGFLKNQVRMMVATIIRYCEGKISQQMIKSLLANPKKGSATYIAPACGLTLLKVIY